MKLTSSTSQGHMNVKGLLVTLKGLMLFVSVDFGSRLQFDGMPRMAGADIFRKWDRSF